MPRPSQPWLTVVSNYTLYRSAKWSPRDAYRAACKDAGVSADRHDRAAVRNLRTRLRAN